VIQVIFNNQLLDFVNIDMQEAGLPSAWTSRIGQMDTVIKTIARNAGLV
jgi:hypothetical protein